MPPLDALPSTPPGAWEGFFFQNGVKRLFGCYHPPYVPQADSPGVVLCYPTGHEYAICHRAFRQLGQRLAMQGLATLRFDYYGSGDSEGDSREASLAQWISDVGSAIHELRIRGGVQSVCLVGCRLGASLAYLAASERGDATALVLCDPIVNGRVWLDQLEAEHRSMLLRSHVAQRNSANRTNQLLGFPIPDILRAEVQALDLLAAAPLPQTRVLIIESGNRSTGSAIREQLQSGGANVCYRNADAAMPWAWTENPNKLLVPSEILHWIGTWLKEERI